MLDFLNIREVLEILAVKERNDFVMGKNKSVSVLNLTAK